MYDIHTGAMLVVARSHFFPSGNTQNPTLPMGVPLRFGYDEAHAYNNNIPLSHFSEITAFTMATAPGTGPSAWTATSDASSSIVAISSIEGQAAAWARLEASGAPLSPTAGDSSTRLAVGLCWLVRRSGPPEI